MYLSRRGKYEEVLGSQNHGCVSSSGPILSDHNPPGNLLPVDLATMHAALSPLHIGKVCRHPVGADASLDGRGSVRNMDGFTYSPFWCDVDILRSLCRHRVHPQLLSSACEVSLEFELLKVI